MTKKKLRLVPQFAECQTWEDFNKRLMELSGDMIRLIDYAPEPLLPAVRRRLSRAGAELSAAAGSLHLFHQKRRERQNRAEINLCLQEQRKKGIPELIGHMPAHLRQPT